MSTTSLKFSDALKRRAGFVSDAQSAREQMLKTATGFDAREIHAYINARIAGGQPEKPKAMPWQGGQRAQLG